MARDTVGPQMADLSATEKTRQNLLQRADRQRDLLLAKSRQRAGRVYGLAMYRPLGAATDGLKSANRQSGYGFDDNPEPNGCGKLG